MGTTETLVSAGLNLLLASHVDFIVVGDSSSNAAGGGNPNVCWTAKDDGETVAGGGHYSSQREEFAFTVLVANTIMMGFSQLPSSLINRLVDNIHFVKLVECQRSFSCDALFAARTVTSAAELSSVYFLKRCCEVGDHTLQVAVQGAVEQLCIR